MSVACGRAHGGGEGMAHVDRGRWSKTRFSCGCHKCITPNPACDQVFYLCTHIFHLLAWIGNFQSWHALDQTLASKCRTPREKTCTPLQSLLRLRMLLPC